MLGWTLLGLGVLVVLAGSPVSGLWWVLIGLFIRHAAQSSYQQVLLREALGRETVRRFMIQDPVAVPADLPVPDDLDPLDPGAVELERPLDADAGRDPPDGDRGGDAGVPHPHHEALEDLDALAIAFDDLCRHLDGVAGGDHRQVGSQLVLDDLVEHVHDGGSFVSVGGSRSCGGHGFRAASRGGTADGGG